MIIIGCARGVSILIVLNRKICIYRKYRKTREIQPKVSINFVSK